MSGFPLPLNADNKPVGYNQAVRITHASRVCAVVCLLRLPGARLFSDIGTQLLICDINNIIQQLGL